MKSITLSGAVVLVHVSNGAAPRSSTTNASKSAAPPGRRALKPMPFCCGGVVAVTAPSMGGGMV